MESAAKLTAPVLPRVVPRTRIFQWLDASRSRPVIWVEGPPGAGKTTLVASYLESRRVSHLWYHLDDGDSDPATFFHYLGRLAGAARRRGTTLPHLTPEYLGGLPTFSRHFFRSFFGRPRRPRVLVFDNYQNLSPESAAHDLLHAGSAEIAAPWNVIVISREPPPAVWMRERANRQIAVLAPEQLPLTLAETRRVLALLGGGWSAADVRSLHQRSDGWAAGVVLLAEEPSDRRRRARTRPPGASRSEAAVFEYFAGEVFERLDPPQRDFMLRTALLPRMHVRAAEAISANADAGDLLRRLHERRYFTHRHTGLDVVYEYHGLFRDFLLERGRQALSATELLAARTHAGSLVEEDGDVEGAADLYRDAGNWAELARLAKQRAPELLAHGRHQTLEHWLRALPESAREEDPWLAYWLGMSRFLVDPAGSRAILESAYAEFNRRGEAAGAFLAWSGAVDTIVHEWDDFMPLDRWIRELASLTTRFPTLPPGEIEARVTASMTSALLYRMPGHPKATAWRDRALELARSSPDAGFAALASLHVLLHDLWRGEYARATGPMEAIRQHATDRGLARIAMTFMESVYRWLTGDARTAASVARQGLDLASRTGIHVLDHILLPQPIYAALTMGDPTVARPWLDRMAVGIERQRRLDFGHYHFLAGWERLESGDEGAALRHVRLSLRAAIRMGTPFPEGLNRVATAHVLAARGSRRAARAHLARALRIARQMQSALLVYMVLLLDAYLSYRDGQEARGDARLRRGLALGRRRGLDAHTWWRRSVMEALCTKAVQNGIELPHVHRLVRRHGLRADDPPVELDAWPWPIKVYTLGRFTIVRDGRTLRSSGKAQDRPLALLKAIIALGARDVPEARLLDALWSSAEGHRAHRAFATNLHRLRRMLGTESAVMLTGRRVSLDARVVWVDVWAFERLQGLAEANGRDGKPHEAVQAGERAMRLYHGAFLDGDDGEPWAAAMRERLRVKFLRCASKAGQRLERTGEWARAAEWYQRGLEADDTAEELAQRLMLSYLRLGRRAEALKVYRRCRHALASALAAGPSRETERIRRMLDE